MQEPLSLRLLNMTEALKKKAGFRKRLFFSQLLSFLFTIFDIPISSSSHALPSTGSEG